MSTLVTTAKQAVRNIARFSHELEASPDLQSRLSYARAWYAHREDNAWHFGPSKFCGYQGMTAAEYVDDDPRDGRRTERQLGQWFTEISEDDPFYEELAIGLTAMLAKHGKAPSAKMRINVSTEFYETYSAACEPDDRAITDLLIAVARRLPKIERERVRSAL